jgi:hypothetical protein
VVVVAPLLLRTLPLQAPPTQLSLPWSCCHQEPGAATHHLAGTYGHEGTPCCAAGGRGTSTHHAHAVAGAALPVKCSYPPAAAAAAALLPGPSTGAPAAAPGGMGHQVAAGSMRGHSTGAGRPAASKGWGSSTGAHSL